MSNYVTEAVRLRLAKERALAQVTRRFGGTTTGGRCGLGPPTGRPPAPPRCFVIGGRVLDVTAIVGFCTGQSVYAEALAVTAIEENIV